MMVGQNIGKYRVLERVGRGGMGTVYRAIDETLHREVAIKVLNAELNDPAVARRFRAEAVTVARLNHPGIATIYELFQNEGQWLMVMEFVRGETFEALVARKGALAVDEAGELCMQTLAALAHAHGLGVVHRDLKPANLMITDAGTVKIMDFGIARVAGTEHLTSAGFMMGTPAYMAPEQVLGQDIDARADLYAVGVVFYYLITAKLPFKGDTPFEMAQSRIRDLPTPVRAVRAELPAWVTQVLDLALARAPEQRFQSAPLFREAVRRGIASLPIETPATTNIPPELIATAAPRSIPVATPRPTPIPPLGAAETPYPASTTPSALPASFPTVPAAAITPPSTAPTGRAAPPSMPAPGMVAASSTSPPPTSSAASIGMASPAPAARASAAAKSAVRSSTTGVIVGIVVGVVIAVGIGGLWMRHRESRAETAAEAVPAASAPATPAVSTPSPTAPAASPVTGDGTAPAAAPPAVAGAPEMPGAPASTAPAPATDSVSSSATRAMSAPAETASSTSAGAPNHAAADAADGSAAPSRAATDAASSTLSSSAAGRRSGGSASGSTSARGSRGSAARGRVSAPVTNDTHLAFGDLHALVVNGKKADEQQVSIHFLAGRFSVVMQKNGATLALVPYKDFLRATYVHAKSPKWDATLTAPPADVNMPGGLFSSSRHWLTLQSKTTYVILRLNDDDYQRILETVTSRMGLKTDDAGASS